MSGSKLDVLRQHRRALLLAEIAALLHDVGKFCNLHVETHSEGGSRKWSNDHAYKAVVDNPGAVIRLSKAAAKIRKHDALNNVLNASSPKASDFLTAEFKAALQQSVVTLFEQAYALAELVMLGTPGFATHQSRAQLLEGKDGWLPGVLGVCHNEAHHDKQEPATGEGAQTWPRVFVSTAFGFESGTVVVDSSQGSLDERLKRLSIPINGTLDRKSLLDELAYGLADTRRPINEITLADWAATTAALYKSALATCALEDQRRGIRNWDNWGAKLIDHDLSWRLLRVNFDVLGLYTKAIKIADLLAYQNTVQRACDTVKQLIEEEYPLGNEVYRDTTGIYFTFPDLDLWPELRDLLRKAVEEVEPELMPRIAAGSAPGNTATEQLAHIVHHQRSDAQKALAYPVGPQNYSPCWQKQWSTALSKSEVCPVCRLRPMFEGEETCEHCRERRQSRIEAWKKNPAQTIWLDEIADYNGRLALLVGKFGLEKWLSGDLVQTLLVRAKQNDPTDCTPKNPSPARLRRVWETCQGFWDEATADGLLNKLPGRDRWILEVAGGLPSKSHLPEETVCDGSLDGQPFSVWRQDDRLLTISFVPDKPQGTLTVSWEVGHTKQKATWRIQRADSAPNAFAQYTPALTLLTSPDQFLALVTASEASEVAEKIRQEYQKQFGKVQNRLPLFLGLVFFQRKTPLMAVMDTARRMLQQVALTEETWTVECSRQKENGCWRLRLGHGEQPLHLDVPVNMGDGQTDDIWYPYFFVESGTNVTDRCYRFQHNGRWLVHVKYLREGDRVCVTPSRFAYIFLEHTAQRFEFEPKRDVMLLDELPRLMRMWASLKASDITDTGLRSVAGLLEAKARMWGRDSQEFRHLTETTLKECGLWRQKEKSDVVTPEDVLSWRLSRCLELYLRILKARLKEEKENEQQPATV
jgi:hypothetical protein